MRTDFSSSKALKTPWALSSDQAHAVRLGRLACQALIAEAELTPKPGLVDRRGAGAHTDLSLSIMQRSAFAIEPYFCEMAFISNGAHPSQALRERLAVIGRDAERAMLKATNGSNSHKGAIWVLGLLVSAAATQDENEASAPRIAVTAKEIASFVDRGAPRVVSHGDLIGKRYGAAGARGEALRGFPHVVDIGLPVLRSKRASGRSETVARLDTLLSIMARLDDTCLLYRGGEGALLTAKAGAVAVERAGGSGTEIGRQKLFHLDRRLFGVGSLPGWLWRSIGSNSVS